MSLKQGLREIGQQRFCPADIQTLDLSPLAPCSDWPGLLTGASILFFHSRQQTFSTHPLTDSALREVNGALIPATFTQI
jgi:hypothetical protein